MKWLDLAKSRNLLFLFYFLFLLHSSCRRRLLFIASPLLLEITDTFAAAHTTLIHIRHLEQLLRLFDALLYRKSLACVTQQLYLAAAAAAGIILLSPVR